MTSFTIARDLLNWVGEHVELSSDAERQAVADHIQSMDHPAWGTDWSEFLDGLDVEELMAASEEGNLPAIQVDRSGVGHAWVDATPGNLPADIREEIAAEIIDGGKQTCDDFVASNGQHYRW